MPHVVVRIYTDSGPLLDTAREHQAKILDSMREVPGFRMFGLSGDPASATAVTTTVCADKAGTDASIVRAAALVKELLPDAKIAPPRIVSGEVMYRLRAEDLATRTGFPYLRLRLFRAAPPQDFGDHEADLLKALSAVPSWRAYTAFVDERTGHGVILTTVDNEGSYDAVAQAHQAWVQGTWPGLKPEPPEIFNTTGIYRLDATPEAAPA
jgi:hypothetical protein